MLEGAPSGSCKEQAASGSAPIQYQYKRAPVKGLIYLRGKSYSTVTERGYKGRPLPESPRALARPRVTREIDAVKALDHGLQGHIFCPH